MSCTEYKYVRKTYTYNGKRYEVRGKTKREAETRLAELIARLEHGEVGVSMNMPAERWAEEWLETYIKPRVRQPGEPKRRGTMTQKSYGNYEVKIRTYIKPALRGLQLRDVKDVQLQKFLNSQAEMSYSHCSFLRIILKGMFSQATASRIIPYDPTLNLTLPACSKGQRRSLSDLERVAFNKAMETNPHAMWFKVLIGTGIRPGESSALTVADVDLKQKLIHINKAVESGTKAVSMPKTAAAYRYIPVPDIYLEELAEHIKGKAPSDLVFPQISDSRKMMTNTCIRRYWSSLYRQMDICMGAKTGRGGKITDSVIAPDLCLYCLRHTYCTDLQAAGVPINIARYLMGHSDISVTANIYTHSGIADALTAAKLINAHN